MAPNATKLARTLPFRTIVSTSSVSGQEQGFTRMAGFFHNNAHIAKKTESLAARYNLSKVFSQNPQPQHRSFTFFSANSSLSSSSSSAAAAAKAPWAQSFQRQTVRGFSHQRNSLLTRNALTKPSFPQTIQRQQQRAYSGGRRRPFRFVFKMMLISTALVAIPMIFVFGAPVLSLAFVPLAVGGIVGGTFLLAGGFLFFVVPIVAVGGAITLWFFAMPAAVTAKDLKKVLKRARKQASSGSSLDPTPALTALGPGWEIQRSKPDEWFRWEFPRNEKELDKVSVRMAVFDPNDNSDRKHNSLRWMNFKDIYDDDDDDDDDKYRKGGMKDRVNLRIRNNSKKFSVENMLVRREDDHMVIQIEDDGAKLLNQKWAKKYLELAKLADRAATEIESIQGVKLGSQIVLVRKEGQSSFWNKFSLCGDIALRIPFDRTWVHDVTDE
ncbi:hypothetical protein BGZ79_010140 [Entomortierella chlamydospora]|nr:hypothetical protein BGZ79_010140 [Entomortierella chlamydospora]